MSNVIHTLVVQFQQLSIVDRPCKCDRARDHACPRSFRAKASAAADMNRQCAIRQARQ